ncbi:MAG: cobalamin biosynthesis protein CobW [Rhodospirillales bacterium]|nr:cobalamin biosynthesis protein CobW [Rhodospirillales bacterium]
MKIPATVITGFLGAGKTTLIRHLLSQARGRRLALVINEFGETGVDREILLGCGIEDCAEDNVIELANGCICCTVADEFLPTMEKLLERLPAIDHIVIETSGLALPKPLVRAFNWPEVRSRSTVDGVVAVVDAPAVAAGHFAEDTSSPRPDGLPHDFPLAETFDDQIRTADLVILNKIDLVDAATRERIIADIRGRLGPAVKIVPASFGVLGLDVVLGLEAGSETAIESKHCRHDAEDSHDHDDFESFVVQFDPIADPAAFESRLASVARDHEVLRAKGFVAVAGKPSRLAVQGVGSRITRYFDRPWDASEDRRGRIVVIGLKGLDRAAITATLGGVA